MYWKSLVGHVVDGPTEQKRNTWRCSTYIVVIGESQSPTLKQYVCIRHSAPECYLITWMPDLTIQRDMEAMWCVFTVSCKAVGRLVMAPICSHTAPCITTTASEDRNVSITTIVCVCKWYSGSDMRSMHVWRAPVWGITVSVSLLSEQMPLMESRWPWWLAKAFSP